MVLGEGNAGRAERPRALVPVRVLVDDGGKGARERATGVGCM